MKLFLILFLLFLIIPGVSAYQGIVINNSNIVIYKFDTNTLPNLNNNEIIVLGTDINNIDIGAHYYINNNTYINPTFLTPQEINMIPVDSKSSCPYIFRAYSFLPFIPLLILSFLLYVKRN